LCGGRGYNFCRNQKLINRFISAGHASVFPGQANALRIGSNRQSWVAINGTSLGRPYCIRSVSYIATGPRQQSHSWLQVSLRFHLHTCFFRDWTPSPLRGGGGCFCAGAKFLAPQFQHENIRALPSNCVNCMTDWLTAAGPRQQSFFFFGHSNTVSKLTMYWLADCCFLCTHFLIYLSRCYLTIVVRNIITFWDITPCSLLKVNRRFGGTCHLHFHGGKTSQSRNQREIGWHTDLLPLTVQYTFNESQYKPSFTTSIVRAIFRTLYVHNMFRLLPKAIFRWYYITQNI
jgi:hypothetical protein